MTCPGVQNPHWNASVSTNARWTGCSSPSTWGDAPSTYAVPTSTGGTGVSIQRVGVVGFGQMGSGIAQVCAHAGLDTLVREVDQAFIDKGFQRVDGSLARLVKSGRASEADAKAARGRMRGTLSLADFPDRDLGIEAILDENGPKKTVLAELHSAVPPTTIFCSNTSSLTIVEMAAATTR